MPESKTPTGRASIGVRFYGYASSPMGRRLLVAAACALSVAEGANAKTQLLVSGPTATAASGATMLEVRGAPADAAWAQVTTYVPSGYTINLGQSAGTRIGTVDAQAQSFVA